MLGYVSPIEVEIVLSIIMTLVVYWIVPLSIIISKKKFEKKNLKRIMICSGMGGFIFFSIVRIVMDLGLSTNLVPAILWSSIGYSVLKKTSCTVKNVKTISMKSEKTKEQESSSDEALKRVDNYYAKETLNARGVIEHNEQTTSIQDSEFQTIVSENEEGFTENTQNNPDFDIDKMSPEEAAEYLVAEQIGEKYIQKNPQIENNKTKIKYCSKCGSQIDPITKKCTGCGKQYFKRIKLSKRSVPIIILLVVLLVSVILNIYLYSEMDRETYLEDKTSVLDGSAAATDALQGSWSVTEEGVELIYTFNGDGTGVVEMMGIALDMTYTIDGNNVTYTMTYAGESESQTLEFAVNSNELTLTDGIDSVVFTKKVGYTPATPIEYADIEIPTDDIIDDDIVATDGNIVGSWSYEEEGVEIVYTFNADGTGEIEYAGIIMEMTYTTEDNTVTYTATYMGESETESLYYYVVGNKLTMTDGEYPVTFTKK